MQKYKTFSFQPHDFTQNDNSLKITRFFCGNCNQAKIRTNNTVHPVFECHSHAIDSGFIMLSFASIVLPMTYEICNIYHVENYTVVIELHSVLLMIFALMGWNDLSLTVLNMFYKSRAGLIYRPMDQVSMVY